MKYTKVYNYECNYASIGGIHTAYTHAGFSRVGPDI